MTNLTLTVQNKCVRWNSRQKVPKNHEDIKSNQREKSPKDTIKELKEIKKSMPDMKKEFN